MTNQVPPDETAEIRRLLTAAFTAQELRRFCHDRPQFRPIYDSLGRAQGLQDVVDTVIEYCEKKAVWPELLAEVKEFNPRQYELFEKRLKTPLGPSPEPPGIPPSAPGKQAQSEEIVVRRPTMLIGAISLLFFIIVLVGVVIAIPALKASQERANADRTATVIALLTPSPSPTPTVTPTLTAIPVAPTHTPAVIATTTMPPCMGRSPGNPEYFSVYPDYDPSGSMGDIGDIVNVAKGPAGVRFTSEVRGQGPHEFEWKYVKGELNPNPAQFSGVMYLCCGWGEKPGFDLRAYHSKIAWEARSLSGEVYVEFVIGGVDWVWDEETKDKISPPCPDSLRHKPLGTHLLTGEWQPFEVDLTDIPEEEFVNVIGGFGWMITWGSNGILLNSTATPPAPDKLKTFEIEIRDVRYGK